MKSVMNLVLVLLCLGLLIGSLLFVKTDKALAIGLGASGMLMALMMGVVMVLTNEPGDDASDSERNAS